MNKIVTDKTLSKGLRYKLLERKRVGDGVANHFFSEVIQEVSDLEDISDGYHSFKELYEFRLLYNALLLNAWSQQGLHSVVKSKKHSDGELCFGGGWFIVQAQTPFGQVSNHYELKDWGLFQCEEVDLPAEYDGHTAEDVKFRLKATALLK